MLTEHRVFTTPHLGHAVTLTLEHERDIVPLRTGCRLWSSSYALVERLALERDALVKGKHILELGAGVGACSLACAALGAASVCVTDRDEAVLALAHGNARRNGWYDGAKSCECDVSVKRLDWSDESTYVQSGEFDLIIAADMIYLEEHAAHLANAVAAHLSLEGCKFIACFGVRRPELVEAFTAELNARGLSITTSEEVDFVNEDMRRTALEHKHDDEIETKGGYRFLVIERRDAPRVATDDGAALADFCEEFSSSTVDVSARRAAHVTLGDNDDDDDESVRYDFSNACEFRLRLEDEEILSRHPAEATTSNAAESLRMHGFVILEPAAAATTTTTATLVPSAVLEECIEAGFAHLDEMLSIAREAHSIDTETEIFRFAEICSRSRGGKRYDMTRPEGLCGGAHGKRVVDAWENMARHCRTFVEPILVAAYGGKYDVKSVGCVTSEPGAPEQHFHNDGRPFGIFNAFCAFRPVTLEAGPTSFKNGSHLWDHDAAYVPSRTMKMQEKALVTTPELLKPGSLLVYDYRVVHAGSANTSDARRALGYAMFVRDDAPSDTWNFPSDESIFAKQIPESSKEQGDNEESSEGNAVTTT